MHCYWNVKFILTQGTRTTQDTFTKPVASKFCVGKCSEGDEEREKYDCELVTFQSKLALILFEINVQYVLDSPLRITRYTTSSDTRIRGPHEISMI